MLERVLVRFVTRLKPNSRNEVRGRRKRGAGRRGKVSASGEANNEKSQQSGFVDELLDNLTTRTGSKRRKDSDEEGKKSFRQGQQINNTFYGLILSCTGVRQCGRDAMNTEKGQERGEDEHKHVKEKWWKRALDYCPFPSIAISTSFDSVERPLLNVGEEEATAAIRCCSPRSRSSYSRRSSLSSLRDGPPFTIQ